jgi:hypothetical protein
VQLSARQWNASAFLPEQAERLARSATDAQAAQDGSDSSVGVLRDAFALHSDPERPMSEVRMSLRRLLCSVQATSLRPHHVVSMRRTVDALLFRTCYVNLQSAMQRAQAPAPCATCSRSINQTPVHP